ncbi:MAG: hypothetical protein CM15mV25_0820 [uncultured marine virus]|nr:MAG: hypothetical protein CM15mV25_0820 [uncultured marine virus]
MSLTLFILLFVVEQLGEQGCRGDSGCVSRVLAYQQMVLATSGLVSGDNSQRDLPSVHRRL